MTTFTIEYRYNPTNELVLTHRPAHREFLGSLLEAGTLIASGPHTDPEGTSLIIIRLPEGSTIEDAKEAMKHDPFIVNDALDEVRVSIWNPVLNTFR